MPADSYYEDLNERLASDEFCLGEIEAGEPPIPVIIRRKLAENREREAFQLVKQAEMHLEACNEYFEKCSTDLRLLDEVN